jgi:hypothetical protein
MRWQSRSSRTRGFRCYSGHSDGTDGDAALQLLARWSRDQGGRDPGQHLKNLGMELEFSSRAGD